jgi:hypothetical protein
VEDVRTFLGFSGYYRRFVKDYGKIAKPLTNLLRGVLLKGKKKRKKARPKPAKWQWSQVEQGAFGEIIERLCGAPTGFRRLFEAVCSPHICQ